MPAEHHPDHQPAVKNGDQRKRSGPLHRLRAQRPWQQRKYQVAMAVAAAMLVSVGGFIALGTVGHQAGTTTGMPVGDATAKTGSAEPSAPTNSTVRAPSAAPGPNQAQPHRSADNVIHVTNSGTIKDDRRTLRIVSAYGDLTGQRELAWAADAGHPVGAARCTQYFKFNPGTRVGERPTMLLCWRTSPTKSVFTIAVDLTHRPSESASVASIDKVWRQMG